MSATLKQIRAGIATNLGSIAGIQALAYMPSNPTPPTLYVWPEETDYDLTMQRGLDCYHLIVQAMIGFVTDQGAQETLDAMLDSFGSSSVKVAVESDTTLGGLVDDLRVVKQSGYRLYEVPNVGRGMSAGQILGAEWSVEVYVTP